MALETITSIEAAKKFIKEKLDSKITSADLEVTVLDKGRVEDYKTDHAKGAVIIHYDGSKFGESKSTSVVYQDRNFRIALLLQTRVEHGLTFKDNWVDALINYVSGLKFRSIAKTGRVRVTDDAYTPTEKTEANSFNEHEIIILLPAEFEQTQENI